MSFTRTFKTTKKAETQPVHLNMAPMIDFLVITIAYLLVSASFYTVQVIDSSVEKSQATSGSSAGAETQRVVEVVLKQNKNLSLHVASTDTIDVINSISGNWATAQLVQHLKALNNPQNPVQSVNLNAESDASYGDLIEVMNEIRRTIPNVTLNVNHP